VSFFVLITLKFIITVSAKIFGLMKFGELSIAIAKSLPGHISFCLLFRKFWVCVCFLQRGYLFENELNRKLSKPKIV